MYHMTKRNNYQLLDVLDLDLIVDVHQGDQQVPEVPKTILIRFPFPSMWTRDFNQSLMNIHRYAMTFAKSHYF